MVFRKKRKIHFVGIGGSGMSGIAEILVNMGHEVSGSDMARSDAVTRLETLGAKVFIGHAAENIGEAEAVVVSSAVSRENPEVVSARVLKVPVVPRGEMLGELLRMKEGICVAGAHGKTTTSTMIATVLSGAGLDPTAIIGGRVKMFDSGAKLGKGLYLVAEADESDGSFLKLNPTVAVVTNIDAEHLDYYGTKEKIEEAFFTFCNKVPFFGATIACGDDPVLRSFAPKMNKKFITYGFSKACDLMAHDLSVIEGVGSAFTVSNKDGELGRVELHIPGRHNVLNALAAIQTALFLGVDFATAAGALRVFSGIGRRSEFKGTRNGVTVIDDYGHHPTEIRATISGIRESNKGRRIVTFFQPHRYTRTRDCLAEFHTAFANADVLLLAPIYPAGEKPIEGISAKLIYDGVSAPARDFVFLLDDMADAQKWLNNNLRDGDILLTMGAGDVYKQGEKFLKNEDRV
ncbi:MAG: UDP-N-acetylmuramate--L-alanine ligase [Nitrospinae bacterium]|nr:UDP-N-acetylmuramate--L-alanine ligase [Nitrospinota bacterium]